MDQQIHLLQLFVQKCQEDPSLLHDEKFSFFTRYLESLGATIPPKKEEPMEAEDSTSGKMESGIEEELPPLELDNSGVIPADEGEHLSMGDPNKEANEEDMDKANEERNKATGAFSEGNFDAALQHFTNAIELNPGSAMLHAKRANVLLKLAKPVAAIRDCNKAISINADSATAYKFRGRANRLLGNWLDAHHDLATACKLDYDDVANEWLKEVEPNAKKIQEHNRAKDRLIEEKNIRERKERVRRAQEENRKAAEEQAKREAEAGDEHPDFSSMPGMGGPGGPFGGNLFQELMKDPEILQLMKEDPTLLTSVLDIMQNPGNISKYMNNPNVLKLMEKVGRTFGGVPGFPGGCPMGGEASQSEKPQASSGNAPPPKAPEPDLD